MVKHIPIEKYMGFNERLVGETMEIGEKTVSVYISKEGFSVVRPGVFLIVSSGEGGLIGLVGSKVSRAKYGGEFASIYLEMGDKAKEVYGDIENEYLYSVDLHPLYEVDSEGRVKPFFSLFVRPHQPVYILEHEDIRSLIQEEDGDYDLSFLLYIDLDDYILCRNLITYLLEVLDGELTLDSLFREFLTYAYRNGSSLDVVVNVFKEVSRSVG